jgi:hypothetical protein
MKTHHMPKIIFSVESMGLTDQVNSDRTRRLIAELDARGVPYSQATGSYKGIIENAFVVSAEHMTLIQTLCQIFAQESYLKYYSDGHAELVYVVDGQIQPLGKMNAYPSTRRKELTAWTQLHSRPEVVFSTESLTEGTGRAVISE